VRVIVRYAPDMERQVRALLLLLDQPSLQAQQPQAVTPGAIDCATVNGGHNLLSERANDTTHEKPST
jgi:hypothetical protein